jgi:hypothetical protein
MSYKGRAPADSQLVVKLDPTTGVRIEIDAHRADKGGPQVITLDMEFAQEGGEGPTPYEVLLDSSPGSGARGLLEPRLATRRATRPFLPARIVA